MIPNERNNFEDIDKQLNRFVIFWLILFTLVVGVSCTLYVRQKVEEAEAENKKEIRLDPTHEGCFGCEPKSKCL